MTARGPVGEVPDRVVENYRIRRWATANGFRLFGDLIPRVTREAWLRSFDEPIIVGQVTR